MRVVNWMLIGVLVLVALVVLAVGGGVVWLRTSSGGAFVQGQIERRLGELVVGEVRLGRVEGDILTGVELHDFALVGADGVALIDAEQIRVAYSLTPFFDRRIAGARLAPRPPGLRRGAPRARAARPRLARRHRRRGRGLHT